MFSPTRSDIELLLLLESVFFILGEACDMIVLEHSEGIVVVDWFLDTHELTVKSVSSSGDGVNTLEIVDDDDDDDDNDDGTEEAGSCKSITLREGNTYNVLYNNLAINFGHDKYVNT